MRMRKPKEKLLRTLSWPAPWWAALWLVLITLAALPLTAHDDQAPPATGAPAAGEAQAPAAAAEIGEEPLQEEPSEEAAPSPVVHITVDDVIHPVTAQFVMDSLEHADSIGAAALVIELNTPGGLLTSTRDIFKAMLTARTPVVVFVGPSGAQAASAGFFLLMAADVAAMAPGTNTGAAHPVAGQGQDIEGDLGEKIEQDAAATIRSLALQHGRNVELAEAAVLESRSYTAQEALENGLVELVAGNVAELLEEIDGRVVKKAGEAEIRLATAGAPLEEREMPPYQRLLSVLSHPEIAYILMALGFLGLYMELSHPGAIFPGVVGAICLIMGFYALSVLPINYAGLALVLLALILFVAEMYVLSHGILTVGGVIALVLGSIMLFKDVDPAMRLGLELILGVAGTLVIVVVTLMTKALKVRRSRVRTGAEGLVTERGVARTALEPRGKVFVHGEIWQAVAESPVPPEAEVEVVAVEGLKLRVRAVSANEN